jgi:RND family efflux transporter MFP subunit
LSSNKANSAVQSAAAPGDVPTGSAPGTGRRVQIIAAIVAILLAAAFVVTHLWRTRSSDELAASTTERAAAPPPVAVIGVERAPATRPLVLPGQTAAWYEATIYARVNGFGGKWTADIGDPVHKGQVLATIETPDLDAELAAAKARLKAADAQVKVREAEADFGRTTYERWRSSPKGVVSEQERDAKKAASDSANAQLNAARSQVTLNQADLDRLSALEQFKQVTAPFDGVVVERRIDIGNLVTAGSTASTTPLYRVTQNDPIRVFVDVPQDAAARMKVGVPATITANDLPNRHFDGTITRTAQALNPEARTLRVEVDLANRDQALVPGMYVQIAFQLKTAGAAQVPASALIFRSGGPQVAVVDQAGKVHFHDVTIATDDGNVVELGSGIAPGDHVALNLSARIADGEQVTATMVESGLAAAAPPKP